MAAERSEDRDAIVRKYTWYPGLYAHAQGVRVWLLSLRLMCLRHMMLGPTG